MRSSMILVAAIGLIGLNICSAQFINTVVGLTGSIFNEIDHNPVTVKLVVLDEAGKKINSAKSNAFENGYYYIAGLKPGTKYKVKIENDGYLEDVFNVQVPNTDKYLEISKDFLVKPSASGTRLAIKITPFELNKTKLRKGADFILADMVSTLEANPSKSFEIVCFPDNEVDKSKNMQLTKERAQAIKRYLMSQGISESMISVSGSETVDPLNPPPAQKSAKGKRYIGSTYFIVK